MKRAFDTKVVSNTAVGLPQKGEADGAQITVDTAAIKFTVDGTVPTASLGHTVSVGDMILLESRNEIRDFKAIRAGGVDGLLQITYTEGR